MTTDTPIVLKPISIFTANGKLEGTIAAYDADTNDYLVEVHCANWSSVGSRTKAIEELVEWTDRPQEIVARAVNEMMRQARVQEGAEREAEANTLPPAPPEHKLTQIKIGKREARDLVADAWALLYERNRPEPQFFNFAGQLADIQRPDDTGPPVPRIMTQAALKGYLMRLGDWTKYDRDGTEIPAMPPKSIMEDMLEFGTPPLPRMAGVVTAPYCTRDGEIVTEQGHSESTGLYLHLDGLAVPGIPQRPTSDDIDRALDLLLTELLGDFPFVADSDRAHALAAMLNPIVRPVIQGPTPLHMLEAPVEGSGKGLLAAAIALPATGQLPAVIGAPMREEEWQKVLTSVLVAGHQVLQIDNINAKIDSGVLAAVLTTTVWTDRIMRTQRQMRLPNRVTWLATANNPTYSREMERRAVPSRIDPRVERPSMRLEGNFRHPDLIAWARAHRSELLWACLVLVRAWTAAGRPRFAGEALGSFESWSSVMGGILDVAGVVGFLDNRLERYENAALDAGDWRDLVDVWWSSYSTQAVTAGKLLELGRSNDLMLDIRSGRDGQSANTVMGQALARMRDRVVGNFTIRRATYNNSRKRNEWQLEPTERPQELFSTPQQPRDPAN